MKDGFVNAHTHVYSALAPYGMPAPAVAPKNFLEILERVWWRLDRALDHEALRMSAEIYAAESLLTGTVGLVDHHEGPSCIEGSLDVLADVFQSYGLPAVLTYGATERNDDRAEAEVGLAECARFLRENDRPLVRGVVGLHASFTVSNDTIHEAVEIAKEHDSVLHLHLAEDLADVDDAKARGYAGVVDRLEKLGALIPGSLFAHGVHLNRDEVRKVAAAGCWLIQNPRSNQGNGVGYPGHLDASELVALGTDGYPSVEDDEVEALLEHAAAAGDDLDHVRRRPAASKRLFGAFFDDLPNMAPARAQAEMAITTLRERAKEQARRLWQRLPA